MATSQQVRWEQVQPILDGQSTRQVPFAHYLVNIGAVQGGVINFGASGQLAQDLIRPRSQPPQILPRRAPDFCDRDQEQHLVGQCLARDQVVDVHGPDGVGKTSLISQTMHTQIPGNFPDGMIYLTGRHQTRDDLLQSLFECFYESSSGSHVKVGENDVRRYLAGKRALIAVDDCNDLEEGDAEALSQAAPQSAMLIAGREPQAWSGPGVALHGLPRGDAIALLERLWGRPLGTETGVADAICAALGDVPLAIARAVRTAAGRQVPLSQLLHEVQPQAAVAQPLAGAFFMLGNHLSDGERTVLSSIAAPNGDSVDRRALVAISGLPPSDIDRYLARLVKLDLVRVEGSRYRLDQALRPYVRQHGADEAMRARAAAYYRSIAGTLRAHSPDPDEENVIAALRYYFERQQWPEVIEIVRALDPYLATTGRWGQWRRRLYDAWHAARQLGDRGTEAWVQNQLGIIALGAADVAVARQFFQGALHTWQSLGDQSGATIARWNLQTLLGPPPPPPRRAEPRPSPQGGASPLVVGLASVTTVLVLGLVLLVIVLLNSGGDVTPPPSITTPAPPPVTTEVPPPPPRLSLNLAPACGQSCAPGESLDIEIESSIDGIVTVYWRNPFGGRERLFREPVRASQPIARSLPAPEREGDWVLEGDLNDGQAAATCPFSVLAAPFPPLIGDYWMTGLEGQDTCPGDEVTIYVTISDDEPLTRVELVSRPPEAEWTSAPMERVDDQTYAGRAVAYPDPGLEFYFYAQDERGASATSEHQILSVSPCTVVVYDFIQAAPRASWTGYNPWDSYYGETPLTFPGTETDEQGFALWRDQPVLEDGSRAQGRVLETCPTWVEKGAIYGEYDIEAEGIEIQPGDLLLVRVGFLYGAGAGAATFEVRFVEQGIDTTSLALILLSDSYDGEIHDLTASLDPVAGRSGYFRLSVFAGDSSAQDWTTWIVARIERSGG